MKATPEVPTRNSPRRERRLFAAGSLPREHRPCYGGHHAGPYHRRPDPEPSLVEAWEAIGIPCPFLSNVDCLACGSTLTLPIRGAA